MLRYLVSPGTWPINVELIEKQVKIVKTELVMKVDEELTDMSVEEIAEGTLQLFI